MPPTTPNDPLSDQPDVVWYVRPPAGGQFGPATGQTVQQWIEEGRISGDSLVWREGWRDWREAAVVLPQLNSAGPIPDIETIGSSRTSGASSGGRPAREHDVSVRHQARGIHALVVVVLTLAVVILSVALGWVLLHPTG